MTVHSIPTKGPLIAFGCGGLNGAYFVGTVSFIRDHFDLVSSNISISGTSCGVFAACAIFLELSLSQSFHCFNAFNSFYSSRKLGIFLVRAKRHLQVMYDLTVSIYNKTDDNLAAQYRKFDSIYFGCSSVSLNDRYLPTLKKVLPGSDEPFTSIYDMLHSMTVSTRILPFYRWFGRLKNELLCFDGGATQNFAISDDDAHHRNVIEISAFPRNSIFNKMCGPTAADTICPDKAFAVSDFFKIGDENEQLRRYKIGYLTASKYCNVWSMIKKGLIWNNDYDKNHIADEEKWRQHIEECISSNITKLRRELKWDSVVEENKHFITTKRKALCPLILSLIFFCVCLMI